MTRYVFPALAVALFLSPSPAKDRDDAKKDQEALQGAWKIVSSETGGMDRTEEAKDHLIITPARKIRTSQPRQQGRPCWRGGLVGVDLPCRGNIQQPRLRRKEKAQTAARSRFPVPTSHGMIVQLCLDFS